MLNGSQPRGSSPPGWLSSFSKYREQKTSLPASRMGLGLLPSTAGKISQLNVASTSQVQQTEVGQVRLNLFNNLRNDAELQSATTTGATSMSTNIFAQLAELVASE